MSNFTVPEASGNFCSRGGRFGTHSSNENMRPIYYKRVDVLRATSMPACARSTSAIRTTRRRSASTFRPITSKTDKRCVNVDGGERCKIAIQTNNVEIDDRGYIYIVDRANTGMHILELTGEARKVAGLK